MEGTKNSGAEDASEFFCWGLLGAFLSVLSAPIVNIVSTVIIVNTVSTVIIVNTVSTVIIVNTVSTDDKNGRQEVGH